ncbi:MAG: hypothetical protein K1X64_13190 [Myxococcaceae bacterium]|nr:hypothetical protein [Myxococcaceae bacterium]
MKRYFGLIIATVGVIAGITIAYQRYMELKANSERELSELRLKNGYLEKIGWMRSNPDQKTYKDEVSTFLRNYFKEVSDHLNRHGGNKNFDEYLTELETRTSKPGKPVDSSRVEEKKQTYEYVRKAFDELRAGNYAPTWTGTDKGIRLDIVSTSPVVQGGEEKTRYQLVVWGVPRDERSDDRGAKKVTANATFRITWKMWDEKGKLVNEMSAEGDPSNRIDWPERYVKFFPPMVMLGHYDVDLFPNEVKTVEIQFNISSRSQSGGDIQAYYTWKLDAPAEWKLKAGQTWKGAQESVRSEDEINANMKKK